MSAVTEKWQSAISFLRERKKAYQLAFSIKLIVWRKKDAFKTVFGGPAGQMVLQDLMLYCRATETCVHSELKKPVDIHRSLVLEGRREVWIRIQQHLNLTPDQLYQIYNGRTIQLTQPTGGEDV